MATGNVSGTESATKRLSLDLSVDAHRRFKSVCSATGRSMGDELRKFIERRTEELEQELASKN